MPDDLDTTRREFTHALGLYARCSGLDWAVLMTIAEHTWGRGLREGPVGRTAFAKRVRSSKTGLARSLKRLTGSEERGGLNLVHIVRGAGPRNAKVYALNADWRTWAWGYGDISDGKSLLARIYPSTSASHPQTIPVDPIAVQLALTLREHVRRTVADTELPNPDDPADLRWLRWCGAMERILVRYSRPRVTELLAFAMRHPQWSEVLRSPTGDKRLEAKIDYLSADFDKQPRPNTQRST